MTGAEPVRVTLTARCELERGLREYAEERFARLSRHALRLHEVRLVVDDDDRRPPAYSVEAVAHLHHDRLVARDGGVTQREAVDKVVEKLDRQVLRHKERITEHKGHAPAGADPAAPHPRGTAPEPGGSG